MFSKLLFVFFLLFTHNIVAQAEVCITPFKRFGNCINIKKCGTLLNVLKVIKQKRVVAVFSSDLEFLQKSTCGFEGKDPKVCCEQKPTVQLNFIPIPPDVINHRNLHLLDHNLCGPVTEQKVVGGKKTGVLEFPWMALLGYNLGEKYFGFHCGGTIISKRFILTAAHCVRELPEDITLVNVRVGEHDLSTERDCDKDEYNLELVCAEKYQEFGIEKIHYHPEYSRKNDKNDIALIKLDKDIDFAARNIKPICLPIGAAATMSEKKVTVTGWGTTEFGTRSHDLLLVHLSPIAIEECNKIYRQFNFDYTHICAGGKKGQDSCSGDSGGPLQSPGIYNNDVRFIQHGIVSLGPENCGSGGIPGIYTKVSFFMDWILDTIET